MWCVSLLVWHIFNQTQVSSNIGLSLGVRSLYMVLQYLEKMVSIYNKWTLIPIIYVFTAFTDISLNVNKCGKPRLFRNP